MFIRTLIIFLFISGVAWGQNLTPSTHALNPADFTGKYIYSDGTSFIPVSKSDILGYKSYVALLSQTDTLPPVATELINELGTITYNRISAGIYTLTLPATYDKNKVFISISPTFSGASDPFSLLEFSLSDNGDKCYLNVYGLSAPYQDIAGAFYVRIKIEVYN